VTNTIGPYIKIIKENTSNMCASLLQFSMVGFSLCISSRNLIIANLSRWVRSLFSETHFLFLFKCNCGFTSASAFTIHINDWHTVDILRCQPNYYQITGGSYQPDNTLTIDYKKNRLYEKVKIPRLKCEETDLILIYGECNKNASVVTRLCKQ
jgi:hypothetical protein